MRRGVGDKKIETELRDIAEIKTHGIDIKEMLCTEQNSKRDGKDRDDLEIETVPISQQQQRKHQIKEQFRRNAPRNAIQIRYPVVYRQPALQQQELGHQTGATTPTRWVAATSTPT